MTTTTTATTPSYFIASGAEDSFDEDSATLIRRANRLARNHRIGNERGDGQGRDRGHATLFSAFLLISRNRDVERAACPRCPEMKRNMGDVASRRRRWTARSIFEHCLFG